MVRWGLNGDVYVGSGMDGLGCGDWGLVGEENSAVVGGV